jgi:hypothetical protein
VHVEGVVAGVQSGMAVVPFWGRTEAPWSFLWSYQKAAWLLAVHCATAILFLVTRSPQCCDPCGTCP